MCLIIAEKEIWTQLIPGNFQNNAFEIITLSVSAIILIQVFFFPVGCKWKNKNENRKYHDILISFKIQLYSEPGSFTFLFFWVMEFIIIYSNLDKVKVFLIILAYLFSQRSTFSWKW